LPLKLREAVIAPIVLLGTFAAIQLVTSQMALIMNKQIQTRTMPPAGDKGDGVATRE
jgi:hypothetical protein